MSRKAGARRNAFRRRIGAVTAPMGEPLKDSSSLAKVANTMTRKHDIAIIGIGEFFQMPKMRRHFGTIFSMGMLPSRGHG